MRDHPVIEQVEKSGYPNDFRESTGGIDFFGTEILEGDDVAIYDGEVILKENLEKFLEEELGFRFEKAE